MHRLPDDFPALVARLRGADDVLCVLCTGQLADPHPPFILPAPLAVPPLAQRSAELDRIIAEYAGDAIAELAAPAVSFTADDHAWGAGPRCDVARRGRGGHAAIGRALHVAQPVSRGGTARDGASVAEPVARPTRVAPMMPSDHGS
jgi:hypothetical protein